VQCSVVELVPWSEMTWLLSDLIESLAAGSPLVHLGSCSYSQRGPEAVNSEVVGCRALEAVTT
jgi:hypothetical protein